MRVSFPGIALAAIVLGVAGCSDASMPTKPGVESPTSLRADRQSGEHSMTVHLMDDCDPTTFNGPGGPGPGTAEDVGLPATAQCSATADTTNGSICNLTTSVEALIPGAVKEGRRAIWQLGQVRVCA